MDNYLGIFVSFLVGVITVLGGMAVTKAQAKNYDANTIKTLSEQVNDLVDCRKKDREEIEALRKEFDSYKEKFETHKDKVREYLDELLNYFHKKGLNDYPPPPDEILNN